MRICYLLLSPTLGMHQYTADLARQTPPEAEIHLVTTRRFPRDRYGARVTTHMPAAGTNSGVARETLHAGQLARTYRALATLRPDLVHVTGPHLWNLLLVPWLVRQGVPVIHTIHDPDPHTGTSAMLHLWNGAILRTATHIVVHGQGYRRRLISNGLPPEKVTALPLVHLFLGAQEHELVQAWDMASLTEKVCYKRFALFFGRFAPYKGLDVLLSAWQQMAEQGDCSGFELSLAGQGPLPGKWNRDALPAGVKRIEGPLDDASALALFRSTSLVLLPYRQATQSALPAAAYFFRKPVLVSESGALPEYVVPGETGIVVPPGDEAALAAALRRAFTDMVRLQKMGAAGRVWYDVQRQEAQTGLRALYQRVASQQPQSRVATTPPDRLPHD